VKANFLQLVRANKAKRRLMKLFNLLAESSREREREREKERERGERD
jgi:hypothetical protein